MAVYNQLLIEAGGGIINHSQQSERTNDATVAIGLGGTGTDALIKLKGEIYRRLKPDDTEVAVPTYKNLRFLAIDSDKAKINGQKAALFQLNKATEYFDISVPAIKAEMTSKSLLDSNLALQWLNYENITIKEAANGAGGIRQVGRYLLIKKAAELKARLKSVINSAVTGCTGDLYIHVFAGISGGTGSGTFLDVCYILRHILEEMGKHNATICGYFFLPDVNLSVPEVAADPLISEYIGKNGYAALQELDYLMNLEKAHDQFSQNYGTFTYTTSQQPVDLCHLVSTTNTAGVLMENGYQYAMSVVSDYVLSYMSKVHLPPGVAEDNNQGITLKGHIANLEQAKMQIQIKHGATYDYNILGAANAEMPLSQISTYLASELFKKFRGMYGHLPSENELAQFVTDSQLTYENIKAEVSKGVSFRIPMPKFEPRVLRNGNARLVTACDNWAANAKGIFQENLKALTESMEGDYHYSENPKSLTAKVYNALFMRYVVNPEYGPFFAKGLLYSNTNKNLMNIIDGYLKKNSDLKAAEVRQNNLRKQELDTAEEAFKNSGMLGLNGKCERYIQAMERWYVHLTTIELYTVIESVLIEFKRGVKELNKNLFHVLTTVLETLRNTFEQNSKILTNGKYTNNGSTYTWYILSVPDIKSDLDDEIKKLDVNTVMGSFLSMMMQQYEVWISKDENDIAMLISDFMNTQFAAITQRTILDYLKVKYHTDNTQVLTDTIKTQILEGEMQPKAQPLFWNNPLVSLAALASNATLSVPFNSAAIVTAAEQFVAGQTKFAVRQTELLDRMFMMSFYSGVPLYAYQGLLQLEKDYDKNRTPGIHLYEKGDVDWGTYLPSPIPASFKPQNYRCDFAGQMNSRHLEELKQAEEAGIVCTDEQTEEKYFLKSSEVDIAEIKKKYCGSLENTGAKLSELEQSMTVLTEYIAHMYDNAERIDIPNNGVNGYKEQTFKDYYLKYAKINSMVKKELDKKQPLLDLQKELQARIEEKKAKGAVKQDFFKAIFTGTLQMQRSKIVFTYQKFGSDEQKVFQDSSMKYATYKVYQAYLTYEELLKTDEGLIDKIAAETKKKLMDLTDEDYAVSKTVKEKHNSDIMGLIKEGARSLSQEESTAILNFYDEFLRELDTYIRLNA